ncbi:hypothetical protein O1611_g9802 [Lasiodiplodia mahajangana]|uniref:Uncharacterized protein n=1 Tax=Lasiodiplodia mahajangana TaxID=1108764 RepID=A0ACC2J570_9PEZI|nr:hypothetical protein O1611_g9802 [Lasiodiplodia mahajangana]
MALAHDGEARIYRHRRLKKGTRTATAYPRRLPEIRGRRAFVSRAADAVGSESGALDPEDGAGAREA